MEPIGLIAAMPQESDALLRHVRGVEQVAIGSFKGKRFTLSGQCFLLVTSGIGVQRAGEAARALADLATPRALISFGIAGAVETELRIGDVVFSATGCRLENGALGPLFPLARWPETAREKSAQALSRRGVQQWTGTAVTTNGEQLQNCLLSELLHPILEMETSAIARLAAEKSFPLFSIRAISDGPQAPIPFDLSKYIDANANLQTARLLKMILRHPRILIKLHQVIQNSNLAADNAAIALLAAISSNAL